MKASLAESRELVFLAVERQFALFSGPDDDIHPGLFGEQADTHEMVVADVPRAFFSDGSALPGYESNLAYAARQLHSEWIGYVGTADAAVDSVPREIVVVHLVTHDIDEMWIATIDRVAGSPPSLGEWEPGFQSPFSNGLVEALKSALVPRPEPSPE